MSHVLWLLEGFLKALGELLQIVAYPPLRFVSLPALLATSMFTLRYRSDCRVIWRSSWPILLIQFLLSVLLFVTASVWHASMPLNGPVVPSQFGFASIIVIALSSVLVDVFWIAKLEGYRWLALSTSLLHLCFLAALFFLAGIAVTGDAP